MRKIGIRTKYLLLIMISAVVVSASAICLGYYLGYNLLRDIVGVSLDPEPFRRLISQMWVVFALTLVSWMAVALFLSNIVTRSILKFSKATKEIAAGNLDYKLDIKSKDEIEDLANSFTKMTQDLKESRNRLELYSNDLERDVRKRTKELEEAKADLEETVDGRTKELQDRQEELIKGQTAMLYMVEDLNRQTAGIKESQKRMKTIMDAIDTGILIIDAQTRKIVDGNPAACKMIGLPFGKIIGRVCHQFVCPAEVNKCPILDLGQKVDHSEKILINAKREKIPVIKTAFPITLDGRKHILDNFVDITKLKKAEKELKDAQEAVIRSEKLSVIGQLASSVAHELRNPLGVMKNTVYYFNMLELSKKDAEVKENLDILSVEIEKSDKIISDLLDFARVKKPTLHLENINLIVKEVLNRVKIGPEIKVVTDLEDTLPDIEVDAVQIQQVFYNIATNAIQAMEKGGRLTIKTVLKGSFLEVSFVDTGSGISKENLTKIFDPLFSTKTHGTGLGLSVCSSLIEGHGGKIEIESEIGKGTTFMVKLPTKRG